MRPRNLRLERLSHEGRRRSHLRDSGIQILLGTSAFTASGWEGGSYLKGIRHRSYNIVRAEEMVMLQRC
jgi:hypothetical protein